MYNSEHYVDREFALGMGEICITWAFSCVFVMSGTRRCSSWIDFELCAYLLTQYIYIHTLIFIYLYIYISLETNSGPRPLRSSASDDGLWCKAPLRLREVRQLVVGNGLLQFTLLMCAAQAYKCNIALLEHPPASSTRYDQLPPSIWRLKATKLLLLHPGVQLHLVQQGFYGGASPKPTTVMIAKRHQWRSHMHRSPSKISKSANVPKNVILWLLMYYILLPSI